MASVKYLGTLVWLFESVVRGCIL